MCYRYYQRWTSYNRSISISSKKCILYENVPAIWLACLLRWGSVGRKLPMSRACEYVSTIAYDYHQASDVISAISRLIFIRSKFALQEEGTYAAL